MDLQLLKKLLLNPEVYPDHPKNVGFTETHISLLFFTGNHVYKLKKPVDFGFLDFTTLEKRKFFCEQEVLLNKRLSPNIYLGIVKVTYDGHCISFNGLGEVVEYAVKMKQIPEEFLMDRLLREGKVTTNMIEAISEKLAQFYSKAETNDEIKGFAKPDRIKQDTDENFEQTEKYINLTIEKETYLKIKDKTNEFLKKREDIFYQRINEDRIRDCHGDLRLEHIFLGDEISIFDCIEFNKRFRYTDVAADLAFLAMDLDYHDRNDLNEPLIKTYIKESKDYSIKEIFDFYKCYRAYVRGKVESFRLDDILIPEDEKKKALQRAKKYFNLSLNYSMKF
jgi:aminoglycoside phosphotransferase family enzyme